MIPQANQIYRHFKGNLYRIITVAVHTETEEELVIYQALYGDFKVYARPLSMFLSEIDKEKYPLAAQKMRFEPVEQMVEAVTTPIMTEVKNIETNPNFMQKSTMAESTFVEKKEEGEKETAHEEFQSAAGKEESMKSPQKETDDMEERIDPLLEAYLDTDSYREKINILHGLQHRITEHMLNTMSIVIDFELPEGDIQTKYDALNDCLMTKEKYECNRMI